MTLDVGSLMRAIDRDLGRAVSRSTRNSEAVDNLYEAFLFALVLRKARAMRARVRWHNLVANREVRFRGSPGEIYSPDFSYATIAFESPATFELHQGIRVSGVSGVAHECDVVVLHAGEAAWRSKRGLKPIPRDVILVLEAKAYSRGNIGLGLARQVLGLSVDLNQPHMALVAAVPIGGSADALLPVWKIWPFGEVTSTSSALVEDFIRHALEA